MRELKFRVWSDFWEKYADFGAELCMDGSADADFEDDNGIPHHESTDLIIEQCTGLKDKNGKEIYEGDIVKQLMYTLKGKECFTTWVVGWNDDEFCYELHRVSGALYGNSMLSTCESKDCEVIGNIHENPELIGKEKE